MGKQDVGPVGSAASVRATGTWCTELDLSDALPDVLEAPAGEEYGEVRCLVRLHGESLGYLRSALRDGRVDAAVLLRGADDDLTGAARRHLAADGMDLPATLLQAPRAALGGACADVVADDELVTVVVCTRNRADQLARCLHDLGAIRWAALEILIVDNAPENDATKRVVERAAALDSRIRYVLEPRPGLSVARNRGLSEARGTYAAFTDDDVRPDALWISGLLRGFRRRADVACVTGLVCTASLTTPAEFYFDARVSWADSCNARIFDLSPEYADGLYPYSPGRFGTGANFAFRTDVLRSLGGFDEALGAGSRTRGGEDLDIFVRVLLEGHAVAYEPAALVWHHHRSDLPELQRQMFAYGTGLTAFLAKHLLNRDTRSELLKRVPQGVRRILAIPGSTERALGETAVDARGLLLRELAGCVAGPVYYVAARRALPRTPEQVREAA